MRKHIRLWLPALTIALMVSIFFGGGVQRVGQNDSGCKVLQDLKDDDSSLENPCGELSRVLLNHKLGIGDYLGQAPAPSSELSNHSHKGQHFDHSKSLRLTYLAVHDEGEPSCLYSSQDSPDGAVLVSLESTNPVSSGRLQDEGLQDAQNVSYQDWRFVPSLVFQECAHRKAYPLRRHLTVLGIRDLSVNISGTSEIGGASVDRKQDKAFCFSAYPYYTTTQHPNQLKPRATQSQGRSEALALYKEGEKDED